MTHLAAPPEYWNNLYASHTLRYAPGRVLFKDLFARHLPHGGTCLEVGCYPGDFLAYLGLTFDYEVSGIDTTPLVALLTNHFHALGARVGTFTQGDFFALPPTPTYDVVTSFGFVEHFDDTEMVIAKHAAFMRPGGTLFISAPNFCGVHYPLHYLLDRANLERHVLAAMSLPRWRSAIAAAGLSVVAAGYYQTADFWTESPRSHKLRRWISGRLSRLARAVNRRVNWPNRWTSPYMYCIARKT
jgi:2-polyprenyl-3-methyl-5-hydroxy-6-metoxy-1,4-benzoquinol methylase